MYCTISNYSQILQTAKIGELAYFVRISLLFQLILKHAPSFTLFVAEKVPISTHATVGLYYFSQGKSYVWAAEQMIKKDIRRNNEFYVAPVYNELIERGDKIKLIESDFMWGLGTPEDVEHFEKYYKSY